MGLPTVPVAPSLHIGNGTDSSRPQPYSGLVSTLSFFLSNWCAIAYFPSALARILTSTCDFGATRTTRGVAVGLAHHADHRQRS